MEDVPSDVPRKRRRRRSDGLVVHFASLNDTIFNRGEIYRSEDGAYEVTVGDAYSIGRTVLQGLLGGGIVTWLIFSDKWGYLPMQIALSLIIWTPIVGVVAYDLWKLWRHPHVEDERGDHP